MQGFEGREWSTHSLPSAGRAGPGRLTWLKHGACVRTMKVIEPRGLQPREGGTKADPACTVFLAQNFQHRTEHKIGKW